MGPAAICGKLYAFFPAGSSQDRIADAELRGNAGSQIAFLQVRHPGVSVVHGDPGCGPTGREQYLYQTGTSVTLGTALGFRVSN